MLLRPRSARRVPRPTAAAAAPPAAAAVLVSSCISVADLGCLTVINNDDLLALFTRAIQSGASDELRRLLRQHRSQWEAVGDEILKMIVVEGSAELARAFFAEAATNYQHHSKTTKATPPLLHIAVEQDNAELVWVLLQRGSVDPNSRDSVHRRTALHIAVEWNSVDIQRLLVHAGADVNARDVDGWTSLHIAAQNGYVASLEFLVSIGAHLNRQDTDGLTPLHLAAREGHIAAIDLLVKQGADLHAKDVEGQTVLHLAAFVDESAGRFAQTEKDTQATVVTTLLAHGADVSARDARGYSVLRRARRENFDIIVELLQRHRHTRSSHPAKRVKR